MTLISALFRRRYVIHTRNTGLTQSAGICIDLICFYQIGAHGLMGIGHTAFFVMPGMADRVDRTSGDALSAGAMAVMKTPGMVIRVRSGAGGNRAAGHDGTGPNGLSNRRDESIAKTKCSQTGGIGGMAFGPVGAGCIRPIHAFVPKRRQNRSHG